MNGLHNNEVLTVAVLNEGSINDLSVISLNLILDSERSDECIDFTMIITNRNNAPISNYGGDYRGKKLTFSNSFQKIREKQKKNDGKTTTEIFDFFEKFFLKCRCFWMTKNSNFYEICRKRENLQYKSVDKILLALKYLKMHNFFLLAFEVQILTKIRQNYEYLQIILPLKHKPPFSPTTGNYILG
ncbi:hypothetical protein AGLY_015923 [Aphis glycines]|uniref:Uncharacterized protein n=1 Tax=Aphis glycines TaxID=307491 RepID=A0A6G0T030_APHGL|nr:hypothetical protein AGLY_015923 [Aphis glycines]